MINYELVGEKLKRKRTSSCPGQIQHDLKPRSAWC